VGVGDTVTSKVIEDEAGNLDYRRGGSDRNFLQLIQDIGLAFNKGNVIAYVDSSGGEVENRRPVQVSPAADGTPQVTAGPGDPRDRDDPLTLSVVFPGGHEEYAALFQSAAQARQGSHQKSRQK
jgi:glucosylglycerol 3-phosphatase